MTLAVDRDGPLLHRLEQRRLRLGGRAVDLVGEHEIRKDGPRPKGELLRSGEQRDARDVGRHQVGRELDTHETHVERERERAHQQRLGSPGDALEQDVPAREQADEDFESRRLLSQHHFP